MKQDIRKYFTQVPTGHNTRKQTSSSFSQEELKDKDSKKSKKSLGKRRRAAIISDVWFVEIGSHCHDYDFSPIVMYHFLCSHPTMMLSL